jgi:ATPase family associated with various cellular activities (AAA)
MRQFTPAAPFAPPPRPAFQSINWRTPRRIVVCCLPLLCLIYALSGLPGTLVALIAGLVLLSSIGIWLVMAMTLIDRHIGAVLGPVRDWPVHSKVFPLYKLIDIHRAAQTYAARHGGSIELASQHGAPLVLVLGGALRRDIRRISAATMIARKIGYEEEAFVPVDTFWIVRPPPGSPGGPCVIRVWYPRRGAMVEVEVAAARTADAHWVIDELGEIASANSIYRGKMIRVVFAPEVSSSFDDDESFEPMDLLFYKETPIPDEAIIMDEATRTVIERTVIDFHQRRAELVELGLPGKRGVLFYGPPGTGKTYTCKYIAHRLTGVTTVVVTGHALLHMKAVCAIAKLLQPALVLLEDVDLVFTQREINPHNTVLGEFIDQLDGFGEQDQVIFILTTNAIDRIENAIKDRPGRVSQCIFFGPPNAALRRRYLEALAQPYITDDVHFERVVRETDGVSQAFLKELVFRTIQIASAAPARNGRALMLTDADFSAALTDMTAGSGRAAQRIIGFRIENDR